MIKYYVMSDNEGNKEAGERLLKYYKNKDDIDGIISTYDSSIRNFNYNVLDDLLVDYEKLYEENKQIRQQMTGVKVIGSKISKIMNMYGNKIYDGDYQVLEELLGKYKAVYIENKQLTTLQ